MSELVRYDAARHALAEAHRVDEAKDIRDKAEALLAYARQRNDVEMEAWVAEIKLRATRRIGELSRELETAPSGRASLSLPSAGKSKAAALKAAGISTSAAHRAEQVAAIPQEDFEAVLAEKRGKCQAVTADDIMKCVIKSDEISRARKTYGANIEAGGLRYRVTVGRFPDARLAEIFISNHKNGSHADTAARDSGIVASIALQLGADIETLRKALCRDGQGRANGPLGVALDRLAAEDGGAP